MSQLVLKNPLLRTSLRKGSETLEVRLLDLADELERIDPVSYETVTDQISESLLDLDFVQMETDMLSFRLGQVIEQQKSEHRD
jgi:hypothetical protein